MYGRQKHPGRRREKQFWYLMGIGILLAAGIVLLQRFQAQAVYEEDGVHIDAAAEADSMLIIGTHLIHLSALNDELYQLAETSASKSNQMNRYYKSELADGKWIDITSAVSLSDIMETGSIVEDEEIGSLFLTHRTGADGITHDLRNGRTVSIFDITPLYTLDALPELEPLKLKYERMAQADSKEETEQNNLKLVREFFDAAEIKNNEVITYDKKLQEVQDYYTILCENNAPQQEKTVVLEAMGKLDASRRAIVYRNISAALRKMSDKIGNQPEETSEEETSEEEAETETETETETESETEKKEEVEYKQDGELMTAMEDSSKNLSDSLAEAEGNELAAGDTVMSMVQYQLYMQLIDGAAVHNHSACDAAVVDLLQLKHIMDAEITDAAGELELLSERLLPQMDLKYGRDLSMGVSPEYKEASEKQSSHVVLENIMARDTAVYDAGRNELQFYIQAVIDRTEAGQAQEYIKIRMEAAEDFLAFIPEDEFAQAARDSVDRHMIWLQKLLQNETDENTVLPMDRLYEEKAQMQEKRLEALDKEDLEAARILEAKIMAKDEEIKKAGRAQEAQLNSLYDKKSELEASAEKDSPSVQRQIAELDRKIAIAGANLSEGQDAANIEQMKLAAREIIKSGSGAQTDIAGLSTNIDGLAAFLSGGSPLAGNALKEIYRDMVAASFLKDEKVYEELIQKTEDLIAQYSDVIRPAEEKLSPERAVVVLEKELGGSIRGITSGNQGTAAGSGNAGQSDNTSNNNNAETGMTEGNGSSNGQAGTQNQGNNQAGNQGAAGSTAGRNEGAVPENAGGNAGDGQGAAGGTESKTEGMEETPGGAGETGGNTEGEEGTPGSAGGAGGNTEGGGGTPGSAGGAGGNTGNVEGTPGGAGGTGGNTGNVEGTPGSAGGTGDNAGGAGQEAEEAAGTISSPGESGNAGEAVTAAEGTADTQDTVAAVLALAAYGEYMGDEALTKSAQTLTAALAGRPDAYLYSVQSGMEADTVSAEVLAAYLGYRYLWNDTRKTAILAKGESFYQYQAFRKEVTRNGGNKETMPEAAGYAGDLYLPAEYVFEQFGCKPYMIQGTGYAVLAPEEVMEEAQRLQELLLGQAQ